MKRTKQKGEINNVLKWIDDDEYLSIKDKAKSLCFSALSP